MLLRPFIATVLLATAGGLGYVAYKAVNPSSAITVEAPIALVRILVAAQLLQSGTLIKASDLRERAVPAAGMPEGAIEVSDDARAELVGAMVRRYLDAGAAVMRADVLRPRDRGFLAAVLSPGTRAVSIGVDARSGASGLISPGDLVDIILTQEFQRGDTAIGRRVVAETVLTGIRVIAVDQQIAQGAPAATPESTAPGMARRVASTVTLQVTPEQSERVAVAERLGRLLLTIRPIEAEDSIVQAAVPDGVSPEGRPAVAVPRPAGSTVFGSDVSAALTRAEPSTAAPSQRMRVYQGSTVSDLVFR